MANILPWGTACIIVLCVIIVPLRLTIKKRRLKRDHFLRKLNRLLRRGHKWMGLLSPILIFMHCSISGRRGTGQSSELGAFLLIVLLLLALSYALRKVLKKKWLVIHRGLAVILLAGVLVHIIFGI